MVDDIQNIEEAPLPEPFDYIEEGVPESPKSASSVPTSGTDFFRALKDSKVGSNNGE